MEFVLKLLILGNIIKPLTVRVMTKVFWTEIIPYLLVRREI